MSSDHAGIALELTALSGELLRVLARIDDARQARDYLQRLRVESRRWTNEHDIDQRPWTDNARYRKGPHDEQGGRLSADTRAKLATGRK